MAATAKYQAAYRQHVAPSSKHSGIKIGA